MTRALAALILLPGLTAPLLDGFSVRLLGGDFDGLQIGDFAFSGKARGGMLLWEGKF